MVEALSIIPKLNALSIPGVKNSLSGGILGDFAVFWAVPKIDPKVCEIKKPL